MASFYSQPQHETAASIDPLLSGKEAARLLGMSYPTFLRRVADGTVLPPLKLGALSRWPESEILAVIETAKAARSLSGSSQNA